MFKSKNSPLINFEVLFQLCGALSMSCSHLEDPGSTSYTNLGKSISCITSTNCSQTHTQTCLNYIFEVLFSCQVRESGHCIPLELTSKNIIIILNGIRRCHEAFVTWWLNCWNAFPMATALWYWILRYEVYHGVLEVFAGRFFCCWVANIFFCYLLQLQYMV